jgi:catalytic LigB subunit of aromatic ring-opening dioxygenase
MVSIVFGAGTSHTPMLNAAAEEWPLFEELDRQRPHLHKDGRRATYEELLAVAPPSLRAELAPEKHAWRHSEAMAAVSRLRDGLIAARLDAVIVVGDDQKEVYHEGNMPSVLVYRGETIPNVPNRTRTPGPEWAKRPAWSRRATARYYEESETRHYPVNARLANHLIGSLIDREFDVASANALPEGEGEGHAFGFVHQRILKDVAIPVVPIFLNTYYPPNQPSPRRCYKLGQAIREAVDAYPEKLRIGVVASGGLSHFTVDEVLDARSFARCGRRTRTHCKACRARSSIPAAPRSATGFAPPARSNISICAGCTTTLAIARLRAPAPACASRAGPDGNQTVFEGDLR